MSALRLLLALVRFRLMNVIIAIVALETKALSLPTGAYN